MEVTVPPSPASVTALPGDEMDKKNDDNNNKNKKKKPSFTLMKAAISLIRRKPNGKNKSKPPNTTPSHDVLNTIVRSVRPLHLPDNQSLMSPIRDSNSPSSSSSIGENSTIYGSTTNLQDLEHRGLSRNRSGSCPNLRDLDEGNNDGRLVKKCPLSSFASAMSLLQLGSDSSGESDDENNHEEEEEPTVAETGGDEMIDSKADNFIAQFYSHIKVEDEDKSC